jgi:hypothetical protein
VSDGTISCGCGRVTGLPDRKTSMVRDGVEHRYGKLCRPVPAPERAGREGDQVLPVEGIGDVIEELRARLAQRKVLGVRRYGRALQAFNGRDAFRDAEDELLDQYVYLTQVRGEHRAVVAALIVLGRFVRDGTGSDAVMEAVRLAEKLEAVRV